MSYPSLMTSERVESRIRSIFTQVYAWMTAGLLTTGAVASLVSNSPALLNFVFGNVFVFWGLFILQLVLVVSIGAAIMRLSTAAGLGLFILYAALNGVVLSSIFLAYTRESIATAFFVTGGMFGLMSAVGFVTKLDLSRVGSLAFMALIGLILASIVNIFLRSEALYWITTYLGVIIFVALTASDTQKIKRLASEVGPEHEGRVAVLGALTLYLDFINLFLFLLRIFGRGSRD